jgi:hypothetical protein
MPCWCAAAASTSSRVSVAAATTPTAQATASQAHAWAYRRRILAAVEADTFYGTLFDRGWSDAPHRALRNSTVEAWELAGRPKSGSRPGEDDEPASRLDGSPINRYASSTSTAAMTGGRAAAALGRAGSRARDP